MYKNMYQKFNKYITYGTGRGVFRSFRIVDGAPGSRVRPLM